MKTRLKFHLMKKMKLKMMKMRRIARSVTKFLEARKQWLPTIIKLIIISSWEKNQAGFLFLVKIVINLLPKVNIDSDISKNVM